MNYLYNPDDTVHSYTVQSGPSTTYTYYPDGRPNTIVWSPVAGSFKYRYTLTGRYQSVTFPNGATRNYSYDNQERVTNLTNLASGGTNRATYAYAYDHNWTTGLDTRLGQRTSLTATVPSQSLSNSLFRFEYDSLYRLAKVTYPNVAPWSGEVDSWTYDALGNRTSQTVNGVTINYAYQKIGSNPLDWQRLTSDGVNAYGYDANGNTLTKGSTAFSWNYDDRMTGITGTSSYTYDYRGRRSGKTVGTTSNYLYKGVNLIQESGATSGDYLFGPGVDEPLAMSRGGSIYYYAVDGLGSVTLVANSSFVVQNKYLYDAWGQTRSSTTPVGNPFVFTGREVGEAGTLFYRARYYQPGVGRFLSEDPLRSLLILANSIGAQGQPSQSSPSATPSDGIGDYRYASGQPTVLTDPLGLCSAEGEASCRAGCLARGAGYGWCECVLCCWPVFEIHICHCSVRPEMPEDCRKQVLECMRFAGDDEVQIAKCLILLRECLERHGL